jgi:hypothetical protein
MVFGTRSKETLRDGMYGEVTNRRPQTNSDESFGHAVGYELPWRVNLGHPRVFGRPRRVSKAETSVEASISGTRLEI